MDNSERESSEDELRRPLVKRKKKAKNTIASDTEEEDSDVDIRPRRLTKPRRCESEDENNNSLNDVTSISSGSKNCTESLNDLSDNDQADKCAICLSKFLGQDIATPETCDHVFCLECIQEWSKNVNTCPIDRLKFNLILIRHHKEEKIIKTIIVNNSALPYSSDSETESQGQADYCELCGEDKNEGALLRCHECRKFYHYHCILPTLHPTPSDTWQCPACEHFIWGTFDRMTPSAFRAYRSLNSGVRTHSPTRSLHSTSQEFLRLRHRVLYPRSVIQHLLSSESSEEEPVRNTAFSRVHQGPLLSSVTSRARCPLLRKRRNLCRARNRALVSATSAATESNYESDSGDDYRLTSPPTPETFDVVGSILESQTRLHCPDILTLARDGTLLQTPKSGGSARSSNIPSSTQNSEESAHSSFNGSSPLKDNTTTLPFTTNADVKQRPLHPSHGNSSKYSETSMQAYSCSSSGTARERTLSYDENTIARPAHGANSNDRFGNDSCSPAIQKGFCLSASSDDMKKDGRTTKGQHSEDEVDIYSDIESVGEEDGVTNDSVQPVKVAFKCDDSQLSNPNDSSDSSDNDLVIDEDQQAEEDPEKFKDIQESKKEENNQVCDSEESNMSSNAASDQEQLMIDTGPLNPSSPRIENTSDNCFNPGDESSHGVFVNDESNHSKVNSEHENTCKDESDSDAGPQVSDVDMQEDGENSVDSAKKSYQGDCTSVKSSPKSCRGETADGFEMQCENSVSNENSRSNLDNMSYGQEESKEVFEEVSDQGNEDTCNSGSGGAEAENFDNENSSNLSEPISKEETDKSFKSEKSFDFANDQQNFSEPEELMEDAASQEEEHVNSEPEELMEDAASQEEERANNTELINICNDISMKSDEEDNLDSLENASTPCMDENLEGQIENSPMQAENSEEEVNDLEKTSPRDSEDEKEDSEHENAEDKSELAKSVESSPKIVGKEDPQDGSVDLGIEDISDAGSEEISKVLNEEALPTVNLADEEFDDVERKVASLFSPEHPDEDDCIIVSKQDSAEKCSSPHTSQSFEDQEEGEIIEERPVHRCKKKRNRSHEETGEYGEYAPRVNISDLPRIPKLKRDRDKDNVPETMSFDNKRTSVLSRVDLGGDISWKRLSKHTRERSYRDGRPKDERLLFRERESRKKAKKPNDASRRNDSKNSERRRDDKKSESEKSKGDYDSRSRKSEKSKTIDYNYSERDKRKLHKEKHSSKDRHSKDKKEKDKYDKKYSKDDDKYEREKLKEEIRYERDVRYDKEERFERIVYEKGKIKEKDHKGKHKDRKSESSKTCKEHSRDKHKYSHSSDHFSDKQREVRKIDDKIKIVVEQKESRKEKSKHKERKEIKIERKPILQRKVEPPERSPYKEITSIESKEIFAKGDSIIINVNFNRATSPKVTPAPESDTNAKERKVLSEDKEVEDQLISADLKSKSKQISIEKNKTSLDNSVGKRPTTPTAKNTAVLSVSESYWQGGDDPDGNNSPASEKSVEIILDEVEDNAVGSGETNSCSSSEATETKNTTSVPEKTSLTPNNEANDSIPKENDSFTSKRRSPRSPSPPSPADNDSYDPCEPTRSPSPPPMPPSPPLPTANPKPPPSPELPPLPPEPEPTEESHKPNPPDFVSGSSAVASNVSQANTVHTQTSTASPMQSLLLPPSFLSRVSAATNTLQGMSPLTPSRNGNFQMNNHGGVMLPSNQMQQIMGANFMSRLHGGSTLPPPPNPPTMSHMTSVPPPPPPPSGMTLLSQVRHPRMNVQPPLTPNSLLQSLTMVHNVNTAPMQLIHHLPPNLSGILANHQSSIVQNPPSSLPVSIANQQVMRMVFSQNQMPNHGVLLPSQPANNCNKSQGTLVSAGSSQRKSEKHSKRSPSAEKNEVIDMDVGTPYSPGDSPSIDSAGDYSPACSPEASSPKNKDVFDSLFSSNQRTSEKRTYDSLSTNEKPKAHLGTKKSKHDHKRHAVRPQVKEKHKKARKEQKQADEAQLKILDELPSSAVEMQVKEKFLKKLNRQERVVEEVKLVLKPYYKSRDVTKEEYKDILRKAVPKICHNRSGDINPVKVKSLVESYVKKAKHSRKKGDKKKSKFSS